MACCGVPRSPRNLEAPEGWVRVSGTHALSSLWELRASGKPTLICFCALRVAQQGASHGSTRRQAIRQMKCRIGCQAVRLSGEDDTVGLIHTTEGHPVGSGLMLPCYQLELIINNLGTKLKWMEEGGPNPCQT